MLIACPACASEYEIEAGLVGSEGRSVRCAACSETWFVAPEASAQAAEPEPIDAWEAAAGEDAAAVAVEAGDPPGTVIDQPMPPPRRATPAKSVRGKPSRGQSSGGNPSRRPSVPRPSPAVAAGLAAVACLPLALLGRTTVVRAMPQSAGLFSAVGLPVNLRGVDLREVVAFRNPAEGATPAQLVVEGDLVGVARERVAVAPIEVELRDAQGQSLHRWTIAPPRAALKPAETARFRASLSAPPPQGSQVEVRFADANPSAIAEASESPDHAAHADAAAHPPAAAAAHGH